MSRPKKMDFTLEPSVVLQAEEDTYIWTINKTRLPVPGQDLQIAASAGPGDSNDISLP